MIIMDTEKNKKDTKKKRVDYEEKIRNLEKKIEEIEKREDGNEISTVEIVVGQLIPGLGGIVRALEKSSPEFRRRIAQTDAEIAHRIETGWSVKPDVNYGYSIRPLTEQKGVTLTGAKKEPDDLIVETEEREPIIDIFEEKEYISVIAELPGVEKKDIGARLKDNTLEISGGKYCKTFVLPSVPKSIIDRTYNNGILQLKIERKDNVS
jgi:HSP20 family protein